MDFTSWNTGVGETVEHWRGLELSVQTITEQSSTTVRRCGREAARDACGGAGLNKHATTEQRKEIGRLASRELTNKMGCSWKDVSASWVEHACRTLAPRFIHLWKKSERERKTKSEPDVVQSDGKGATDSPEKLTNGESRPLAPEKRVKLMNGQSKGLGGGPLSPTSARKKPKVNGLGASAQIPQSPGHQFLLCDRNIEVRIEPAAEDMELDTIAVAIAAIVHDDALVFESENIRTEHLSFDKFCRILESTDANFDLKANGQILTYEARKGLGVNQKEVHQESDFQVAIGVLAWNAKKESSGEALVMQIRTTD